MIEETVTIQETEQGIAWVETQRRSACDSCAVNKGCGTSVLSKVLGRKHTRVRVLNPLGALPGEQVVVGVQEQALVKGSLAVYIVPLAGLLSGAVAGAVLGQWLQLAGEALSVLLGLAGLGLGFWWLGSYTRKIRQDERYQPVVLRRAP